MKRTLVLALLVAGWACTPAREPRTPPVVVPVPAPVADPRHYAQNTPEETRAAHRLAVELLQASKWDEAFAAVDDVQPRDMRRRLTEYLALVAAVRLPDQALSADVYAKAASQIDVEPGLLSEQQKSLNQHRAWIAAIQDVLADEAEARNFPRPRPRELQNTRDSGLVSGWDSRGATYDAVTYNSTKAQFRAAADTLDGRLALVDIFNGISAFNVHQVLYVDLTSFHFNSQPLPVLPVEAGL